MERQFNNGEFEKLLRDNANQYRMYPSEKVWKGIHSALHTRRRWYGLTAGIMLLITGSIVSFFIFNNKPANNNLAEQKKITAKNTILNPTTVSSGNEQKIFTPEIKENKPANLPAIGIIETYLSSPVFDTNGEDADQLTNVNLNSEEIVSTISTKEIAEINTQDKNETTEVYAEQPPVEIKLETNIVKAEIEKTETTDVVKEKNIADQSSFDEDTEKKINEAVSALASQNVLLAIPKKQSKVTAQVYFTPTVSYRKLSENKKVYTGAGYNYVPQIDLNNLVKHKPAMGLEFGIEGRYLVSERLSFKAGLQFNINRYDIRAYSHPTEIATVAISSGYGVDSLASLSNYRNFSGNSPNWLENFYFQVGFPIGAEIILADKKNFQWGISGTVQPTYVIGDRAYVLSSDYKNYAKFPDLMRRWNLSTGVGTFISYSTGKIKWQVGPHVRYQHLSSFVSALTVKENLFAAGLKIGATLNKKK